MASLKIRLRSSRVNKNGESPLFIQIFSWKTKKELSLGIAIEAEDWDDVKSQVKRKNQRHGQLNAIIRSRINELQSIIDDLLRKKVYITASTIHITVRTKISIWFFALKRGSSYCFGKGLFCYIAMYSRMYAQLLAKFW